METGAGLKWATHAPVVVGLRRVKDLAVGWSEHHEGAVLVRSDPRAGLVCWTAIDIFRSTVHNTFTKNLPQGAFFWFEGLVSPDFAVPINIVNVYDATTFVDNCQRYVDSLMLGSQRFSTYGIAQFLHSTLLKYGVVD